MLKEVFFLQMQTGKMLMEAQLVVVLRLLRMFGALPSIPGENVRMYTEKQAAFTEAGMAATRAALSGKPPMHVYRAALRPVGRQTSANSRRLSRKSVG